MASHLMADLDIFIVIHCLQLLSMDIGGTVLIFSTELQLLYVQVHGAFAGFSGITTGICNTHYVYFPITQVIESTRHVDPNSRMWHRCLTSTGQPDFN